MAPKNRTIPGLSTKVRGTMECVGKTVFTSFSVRRLKICKAEGRFFRELPFFFLRLTFTGDMDGSTLF